MLTLPTTSESPPHNTPVQPPERWTPSQLDVAIFASPYILIDHDNKAVATTRTLDDALDVLANTQEAVTVVGTLRPPLLGIDVDTDDDAATSEACLAFTDSLISWCDTYGLPWLRRESGRSGHFHLIVKVPPALHRDFRSVAAAQGRWHHVSASVRSTLRLTSAPHRSGRPAGHVEGTVGVRDVEHTPRLSRRRSYRASTARSTRALTNTGVQRRSRSESEYGKALAMARAGWSGDRAWKAARLRGSKAAEIGQTAWRRWMWASAVTIVDAEHGVAEALAWSRFQQASPIQARHLGHQRWHDERWRPACHEATLDRPRRRSIGRAANQTMSGGDSDRRRSRLAFLRKAFLNSAHDNRGRLPELRRPVRLRSLCAALYALATVIVYHAGSVSIREWAERARLDPKTVRRARDAAQQLDIIRRAHQYGGGTADCDSWLPSDSIVRLTGANAPKSPTRLYTPQEPLHGRARLDRLRLTHSIDRASWHRHCAQGRPSTTSSTTGPPRQKPHNRGGKMLAPPPQQSFITWIPHIKKSQTVLLAPALYSPYHSPRAIRALLDAVENLNPDVIVQTGPLLASDVPDSTDASTAPSTDAADLLIRDFFIPLLSIHKGPLLITSRKSTIKPNTQQEVIARILSSNASMMQLTKLCEFWSIADNVNLNTRPVDVAGNYAVTLASKMQISIISAYPGSLGRAQITRHGMKSNTVYGVEIGTLADISRCHHIATVAPRNGFGLMTARTGHIELVQLPSRQSNNASRQPRARR